MAGIPGDASDVRRGDRVRTVTAFPFKSNAVETVVTGKPFIYVVRTLVTSLRIKDDDNGYDKLLWFIRIQIYNSDHSLKDFEELCESLVALIYFGLLYEKFKQWKNIESIFKCFLEKWFGFYETFDISQLILDIEEKYKVSSFGTVILLYHYVDPAPDSTLDELLKWLPSMQNVPQWLEEILSCSEESYQNLNRILYKSLRCLDCQLNITFSRAYLISISRFLDAVKCYKLHQYEESTAILNTIENINCGPFLCGWKEILTGINYEYMKWSNCALIKFKEAMNQYPGCYYALYYSSRTFKNMGLLDAHLECLQLLAQANTDADNYDNTIQKVVLNIHMPVVENLGCRSNWLLASSYLVNEKWTEARDLLHNLVTNWVKMKCGQQKTKTCFLDPSDEIPELPQKSYITMCYIFVLMNLKLFQEVELSNFDTKFEDFVCTKFTSLQKQMKIDILSRIIYCVLVTEALYHQQKFESALTKCGSILVQLESLYDPNELWYPLILLTKVYLYKMLSLLYQKGPLIMHKNSIHFARLQDHCLHLFNDEKIIEDELINIVLATLKNRLRTLETEV